MSALDPKNRKNLVARVASAVVLFPLAIWLTLLGGIPFALLAAVAATIAASELVLMFGAIGAGEVLGIAVAGAIPLMAAFGEAGELLPGWSGLALAAATVVLLAVLLFRRGPIEAIPRSAAVVTLSWLYCGLLLASVKHTFSDREGRAPTEEEWIGRAFTGIKNAHGANQSVLTLISAVAVPIGLRQIRPASTPIRD